MNADQFLLSLQPYLCRGLRGREMAIEEIDSFIETSLHFRDNPAIDATAIARLRLARERIAEGKAP